jgi:hypothetical protein
VHVFIAVALIGIIGGCASLDAYGPDGSRDYAAMSCQELAREAKNAWRQKNERSDVFGKSEERAAADRQMAKQDLKAIKSAAVAKNCILPG